MANNDPEDDTQRIEFDSAGIPVIEIAYEDSITQKIEIDNESIARRLDDAYSSGFNSGHIFTLELIASLLRNKNTSEEDIKLITNNISYMYKLNSPK